MPYKDAEKNRIYQREWQRILTGDIRCRSLVCLRRSRTAAKQLGHVACTASAEEVAAAFTGQCHLCGVLEQDCERRLAMDHCHTTGAFRGWLCGNCNVAIGKMRDNAALLRLAADYLEQFTTA